MPLRPVVIPGRPQVILLDYRARFGQLADDKYLLWKDNGIATVAGDGEVNEVVAFGFTVAEFFGALSAHAAGVRVIAHFHEWMAGVAVPRIAHLKLPVATVFHHARHAAGAIPGQRQPGIL